MSPFRSLKNVVFPHPERPVNTTISPFFTDSFKSFSTKSSPYENLRIFAPKIFSIHSPKPKLFQSLTLQYR